MDSRYAANPGWSEALRLVTGHEVDLRDLCNGNALVNPSVIHLSKDADAGASLVMGDNQGEPAIDRLVQELSRLEKIMPALQAARTGLMDIGQLRQAAVTMERVLSTTTGLDANAQQIVAATSPSADGSHGHFRRSLATEAQRVQRAMFAQAESFRTAERPITGLINDAADALASFGTRMAQAFHKAKPDLVEVATTFWEGANANLRAYWQANGWGPGGHMSRLFRTAPQSAETHWRAAMAAYTSAGLPGLPARTPPVVADLMDGWDAFGAALTQRLGQTLDAMDEEANDAFAELSRAYRTLLRALGGDVSEAIGSDVGEPLATPMRAGVAMTQLMPAQPLLPAMPALEATAMPAREAPVMPALPSALSARHAAVPLSE